MAVLPQTRRTGDRLSSRSPVFRKRATDDSAENQRKIPSFKEPFSVVEVLGLQRTQTALSWAAKTS
jgi:hypothetical protein